MGSEQTEALGPRFVPHPAPAQHSRMGSSLGAVSRLLGPGAPGLSGIHRAISTAMWLRGEPRTSEVLWRLLTRLPLGKGVTWENPGVKGIRDSSLGSPRADGIWVCTLGAGGLWSLSSLG